MTEAMRALFQILAYVNAFMGCAVALIHGDLSAGSLNIGVACFVKLLLIEDKQ